MKKLVMVAVLLMMASPVFAKKSCEELKSEVDNKIQTKGVKSYSLEIVPNKDVKDGKVVGSCDGGTKKIV